MKETTALDKKMIILEVKDGGLSLNKLEGTTADVQRPNGTIHIIGAVLMPPMAK